MRNGERVLTINTSVSIDAHIRKWMIAAILSCLCMTVIPFGNILGPLVIWVWKKRDFPELAERIRDLLNFQGIIALWFLIIMVVFISIELGIYTFGFIPITFSPLGLLLVCVLIGLFIYDAWYLIRAAIWVYEGKGKPQYPISFTFISSLT